MLSSLRRFSKDEVAQKRLEIMSFYSQFGETAAEAIRRQVGLITAVFHAAENSPSAADQPEDN